VTKVIISALLLFATAGAQAEVQVFSHLASVGASLPSLPKGFSPIQVNGPALFGMAIGSEAVMSRPGRRPAYAIVYDRVENHQSGNKTWIGHLRDYGENYRVVITSGSEGSWGRILTPDGERIVGTQSGQEWLVDANAAGLSEFIPEMDDGLIPPDAAERIAAARKSAPTRVEMDAPSSQSTVDVMVVYTQSLVDQLGGALQARVDHLVAITNQAYIDSQIAITLRLVHAAPVSYSDNTSNYTAINELTGVGGFSVPASLSAVSTWRDAYGADLVVLMRAFNSLTQVSCGRGWIGGYGGAGTLTGWDSYGYSVVSNGIDINWTGTGGYIYCGDLTFAHELGHNMGSLHDHRTEGTSAARGVFPYTFGYGVDYSFATVMAYPSSFYAMQIGRFSNPLALCSGVACGVSSTGGAGSETWADGALSMNNIRSEVAAWRPTKVKNFSGAGSGFLTPIITYLLSD